MAASLLGLGLVLGGGEAWGQASPRALVAPKAQRTAPGEPKKPPRTVAAPTPPVLEPVPGPELQPPAVTPPADPVPTESAVDPGLRLAALQLEARVPADESQEYQVQLEPPGRLRLFGHLDSEAALLERMRQEARERPTPERLAFPEEPVLSTQRYAPGRKWPRLVEVVEPNYVCYGKLLFEEKNSERYGWDLGFVQPFLSAGVFFWDVVTLPYHLGTAPGRMECSAGYRLPGDPVPYLLYPPELSLTGAISEAGGVLFVYGVFPGLRTFPPVPPQ
jgi:hypothetical protein